jgi:hypothetical protein
MVVGSAKSAEGYKTAVESVLKTLVGVSKWEAARSNLGQVWGEGGQLAVGSEPCRLDTESGVRSQESGGNLLAGDWCDRVSLLARSSERGKGSKKSKGPRRSASICEPLRAARRVLSRRLMSRKHVFGDISVNLHKLRELCSWAGRRRCATGAQNRLGAEPSRGRQDVKERT